MEKINKHERQFLIERLQKGEDIPIDFKYKIFPTKEKEYELVYAGKMRKEDLLANDDGTFSVPLQPDKIFDGKGYEPFEDGWKNMIVFGDNLHFLKTINENDDSLIRDKVKGKIKLIYVDSPFGTGDEYSGNKGQSAYSAKKKDSEFVEFLVKRLMLAQSILAEDGSIYLRIDYRFGHYIKVLMDEIFGKHNFRNQIIVKKSARPKANIGQLHSEHDFILFYSKTSHYKFKTPEKIRENRKYQPMHLQGPRWSEVKPEHLHLFSKENLKEKNGKIRSRARIILGKEMLPPGNRHWAISQENIFKKEKNGEIILSNKGHPQILEGEAEKIGDVWTDIPGYSTTTGYPTENSEKLLERIIEISTDERDIVLDFFGGSGTTMAVAEKLGRKWITCDLGKLSYFTMQKRILCIKDSNHLEKKDKKHNKGAKSFMTVHLGNYDLKKMMDLDLLKYQEFVSGLFDFDIKKNVIAGFSFEGKKGSEPVKIFDYQKFSDSAIDEIYLQSMHDIIGSKVSGRVYIVAPVNSIDFLADYHEIDNIKYYFLKIPYHVIEELHNKPFRKLRQPKSKDNVNDISDDVVGFHFISSPEVKSDILNDDENVTIIIKSFRSKESRMNQTSNEREMSDFELLSAVFIDKKYDGENFRMDVALFSDQLKKNKDGYLEINFKKSELGNKIMLIYTDIYGNDFTEPFSI